MPPRFERITTLPTGIQPSRITAQLNTISFDVHLSFERPLTHNIKFEALDLHAFALNPGCGVDLEVKQDPGIYRIHDSSW